MENSVSTRLEQLRRNRQHALAVFLDTLIISLKNIEDFPLSARKSKRIGDRDRELVRRLAEFVKRIDKVKAIDVDKPYRLYEQIYLMGRAAGIAFGAGLHEKKRPGRPPKFKKAELDLARQYLKKRKLSVNGAQSSLLKDHGLKMSRSTLKGLKDALIRLEKAANK